MPETKHFANIDDGQNIGYNGRTQAVGFPTARAADLLERPLNQNQNQPHD